MLGYVTDRSPDGLESRDDLESSRDDANQSLKIHESSSGQKLNSGPKMLRHSRSCSLQTTTFSVVVCVHDVISAILFCFVSNHVRSVLDMVRVGEDHCVYLSGWAFVRSVCQCFILVSMIGIVRLGFVRVLVIEPLSTVSSKFKKTFVDSSVNAQLIPATIGLIFLIYEAVTNWFGTDQPVLVDPDHALIFCVETWMLASRPTTSPSLYLAMPLICMLFVPGWFKRSSIWKRITASELQQDCHDVEKAGKEISEEEMNPESQDVRQTISNSEKTIPDLRKTQSLSNSGCSYNAPSLISENIEHPQGLSDSWSGFRMTSSIILYWAIWVIVYICVAHVMTMAEMADKVSYAFLCLITMNSLWHLMQTTFQY